MKETFGDYLQRLKDRRTEDDYKYTDEDFIQYQEYIRDCWLTNLSVYKCLEFMYFAEKEIKLEEVFNDDKKEGIKKLTQKHKLITMMEQDEQLGLYQETLEEAKDLAYWKANAEEDYLQVPISVLRYLSELEKQQERSYSEEDDLKNTISYLENKLGELREELDYEKRKQFKIN